MCGGGLFSTLGLLSYHVINTSYVPCTVLSASPIISHFPFIITWLMNGKESACNTGDLSLTPGLGRSPGGGHGNPLQYFCLENPMDRGAWWATVHGVAKSRTQLMD